jgi:hypothetical protein
MASGRRPAAASSIVHDRRGDRLAAETEPLVGWHDVEGRRREAEDVERLRDREVGLVAGVDPDALQPRPARHGREGGHAARGEARRIQRGGRGQPGGGGGHESREVHVADHRERHEVRHRATGRQHAPARVVIPDEVAQPAVDLLLHEGPDRPRLVDVDPLVDPLGEELADDRERERRRREVGEDAGVVRVELVRRQPGRELGEDLP